MGEHDGHRQRTFEKIDQGAACEHELLEALLFFVLPRRNTNDIAHRLLARYGDVDGVLSAPCEALKKIEGIGERASAFFKILQLLTKRPVIEEPQYAAWPKEYDSENFLAFVKHNYGRLSADCEMLDLYFLDASANIYAVRRFYGEEKYSVEITPEVVGEVFARGAPSGLVMVHNHPSSIPTPSEADEHTTEKVQAFCRMHNVIFCDHVICAKTGVYSYYKSGRLAGLTKDGK